MELIILIISLIILGEVSLLLLGKRPSLRGERAILVDTSVLIDGRLLDIAENGFVPGRLVIPRSVLGELQLLADGGDPEKRNRARNGLDIVTKLQAVPNVTVDIYSDDSQAREGVDNRLLSLARGGRFELCTVDFNLQKVAEAEGIRTLNITGLSHKLRTLYLPGERLELKLQQKGQEKGQAIGYASDGTMVVVDHADKLMDTIVQVEIIRSLQTNSGKMMFARLKGEQTRGEGEAGGRMSRGEGGGATGGRMLAKGEQTRGEGGATGGRSSSQSRSYPRRNDKPAQPSEPIDDVPQQGAQPTDRPQSQPRRRSGRSDRGPRPSQSPEDNLLNLVNKQ